MLFTSLFAVPDPVLMNLKFSNTHTELAKVLSEFRKTKNPPC